MMVPTVRHKLISSQQHGTVAVLTSCFIKPDVKKNVKYTVPNTR